MKLNISWVIFMIGLIPMGLAYYPLKHSLPGWQFVALAIAYLVILRILSDFIARKVSAIKEKSNGKTG